MKNISIPVFALLCIIFSLGLVGIRQNEALSKAARSARDNQTKLKSNNDKITKLNELNYESQTQLASNREFLNEWENSYKRSIAVGLETRIQDGSTVHDVQVPLPRTDNATLWSETEGESIFARHVSINGDGTLTGLVRYIGEIEKSVPLGFVNSLSIKSGERSPRVDIDFMVLSRAFVDMPDLPEDIVKEAKLVTSGVFSRRPDARKFTSPQFSDNLIFRAGGKPTSAAQVIATEISNLVPELNITGLMWAPKNTERRLMANGYILRPGETLPSKLVKGKSKITLTEIAQRFARFTIETEELNPATQKLEKSVKVREVDFAIFTEVTPEG